jgi:hypothetical protein
MEGGSQAARGEWSTAMVSFNASVLTREGRRQDEVLTKDEAEAASSSWLYEKEVWHGVMMSVGGEAAPERKMGGDDISLANANLNAPKIKKIYVVNSIATNGWKI